MCGDALTPTATNLLRTLQVATARRGSPPPAALVGDWWDADAVIAPSETRVQVIRALRALRTKRESLPPKKHGNIPL